jgi:hypothetical protein
MKKSELDKLAAFMDKRDLGEETALDDVFMNFEVEKKLNNFYNKHKEIQEL